MRAKIEEGAINPMAAAVTCSCTTKPVGDFVLKCDVKMSQPDCNSGVFVRTGDLNDPVYSGIEVQVTRRQTKPDMHNFGSIYDLVAPSKDATNGPGKWDTVEIRCEGPMVTVTVNGEKVATINCDEWDEPASGPTARRTSSAKRSRIFRARATSACKTTARRVVQEHQAEKAVGAP